MSVDAPAPVLNFALDGARVAIPDATARLLDLLREGREGRLQRLHRPSRRPAGAFQRHQAAQCGTCAPGMMVSATSLLRHGRALDAAVVADALAGVLCR